MNYISQTHALIVQSLLSRTVLGTVGNAEKQDTDPVREKVNNVLRFQGRTWTEAKASGAEKGQTSHDKNHIGCSFPHWILLILSATVFLVFISWLIVNKVIFWPS